MAPRTVGLIGAACLSAGWLVASLVTPPVARLQSLPARRAEVARDAREAAVDPVPVLMQPTITASAPPAARRNPFVFGRDRMTAAASPPTVVGDAPADEPREPVAPSVVAPPYRLAGIAITDDVRTAVLSDGTAVRLVQAGQTLLGGYTVTAVTDNTVTLTDATGAAFVFRLR